LTGILGTNAPLTIDLTLIAQIIAFALVAIAIAYKFKRKWKIHGFIMGGALALHFINFLAVMIPLFMSNFSLYETGSSFLFVQTLWIHVVSGVLALILASFITLTWIPKPSNLKHCFKRKRLMDATVLLWAISLAFAIATYIATYA
jgi:hypothetical protein